MGTHQYAHFTDEGTEIQRVKDNTPFHPTSKCWSTLTLELTPLIPALCCPLMFPSFGSHIPCSRGLQGSSPPATPFHLVLPGGLPRLSFAHAECYHQGLFLGLRVPNQQQGQMTSRPVSWAPSPCPSCRLRLSALLAS